MLLIRADYRIYRPEADCYGEDLILRIPSGELRTVQLKSRPEVDWKRYGRKSLWMLFPDPKGGTRRKWFLIPHDDFYEWTKTKGKHGRAPKFRKELSPYSQRSSASFSPGSSSLRQPSKFKLRHYRICGRGVGAGRQKQIPRCASGSQHRHEARQFTTSGRRTASASTARIAGRNRRRSARSRRPPASARECDPHSIRCKA